MARFWKSDASVSVTRRAFSVTRVPPMLTIEVKWLTRWYSARAATASSKALLVPTGLRSASASPSATKARP